MQYWWFSGKIYLRSIELSQSNSITWYNKTLDDYQVLFFDKAKDYINHNDFNGANII